jgi:uncharacterized protein YifE (UPF0438 family)
MVIFYRKSDLIEVTEDEHSHVVVLKTENNQVSYFFGAVWEKDVDQITTKQQFVDYLEEILLELNNPVEIALNEK